MSIAVFTNKFVTPHFILFYLSCVQLPWCNSVSAIITKPLAHKGHVQPCQIGNQGSHLGKWPKNGSFGGMGSPMTLSLSNFYLIPSLLAFFFYKKGAGVVSLSSPPSVQSEYLVVVNFLG